MDVGTRVVITLNWLRVSLAAETHGTVVETSPTSIMVAWDDYTHTSVGYAEGGPRKAGSVVVHPQWHVRDGIVKHTGE